MNLLPIEELSRQAMKQGYLLIPRPEFVELHGNLRRIVERKVSKARFLNKPLSKSTLKAQAALDKHRARMRAIHWPKITKEIT